MEEQNSSEWQAPPPPEKIDAPEQPQMSEAATIGGIFIEPEKTFQDLKRKPRFIIAGVIIALLVTGYAFGLRAKFGEDGMRRFISEQIDKSPQAASLTNEQKQNGIDLQMKIGAYTRFAIPIFVFISFFLGGLLYWGGAKAFGGSGTYMQNLSVWVYSGLPPTIVGMIGNFIVLALKSVDDIDLGLSQRGLINANLGFLIDGKSMPVLATVLSTIDLFAIWGWVLAAIGLSVTNRLSKGASWALIILITLIGLGFRVVLSLVSGNPS
jgi:hypothetical protein